MVTRIIISFVKPDGLTQTISSTKAAKSSSTTTTVTLTPHSRRSQARKSPKEELLATIQRDSIRSSIRLFRLLLVQRISPLESSVCRTTRRTAGSRRSIAATAATVLAAISTRRGRNITLSGNCIPPSAIDPYLSLLYIRTWRYSYRFTRYDCHHQPFTTADPFYGTSDISPRYSSPPHLPVRQNWESKY